jgi:hypothetical protein
MSKLYAKTVAVSTVTESQRKTMFRLMGQYYECMDWDRFQKDLDEKDDVILLLDGQSDSIKGFSTLKSMEVPHKSGKAYGIFSGDTVVDRAYWGQKVLGVAFLKYLFMKKASRPFSPLYWLLISKGYKTYLLMANNFSNHFPRFEQETPKFEQGLIDGFAGMLFGESYKSERGVVEFSESLGQLRPGIADVPTGAAFKNPRIAYFAQQNPDWMDGTELVCLAEMTFGMPLYYVLKRWWKLALRPWVKQISQPGAATVERRS